MASEYRSAPSIAFRQLQRGGWPSAVGLRVRAGEAIETWLEAERDQLALWLPVGLGCGIAAWFALPDAASWTAFLLAVAGISGLGFVLARGGRLGRAIGLFALAAAIGCAVVWARAEHVAAPRLERSLVATFAATVEELQPLPARDMVRLTLRPDAATGLPPRIRVNAGLDDIFAGLGAGSRLSLRARLMPPPSAAVPGAYDFARVAWFQGIGATGRALGPVTLAAPPDRAGWNAWLADLRMRLSAHIRERAGGAEGGIAAAFVTGDQGAIAEEDAEAMRRSGLAHLLSISGLHVTAVIAATMFVLMRLLALSQRLALGAPLLTIAAAGGALAGIGYTFIAGAEVPTIRSCIAALLVLAGMAMGREAITLRLVATGALILLLVRPEVLAGPSFQLSFAAVTAIVALHEHPGFRTFLARREEGWGGRIGRSLLSLMLTGIVVEAALAPIALFHFHRAGLYGALANIIAIPLTTFILMPLEAGALLLDSIGLGAPLWSLTAKSLALLLWLAHQVAAAPGAVAALSSMPLGAFALMIAGGVWLALWRTRVRRIGLLPVIFGGLWALLTPPPDILVTGDGRHLALRSDNGTLALLRPRAGDYVRDLLGESAGVEEEALALDEAPNARCGPDLCTAYIFRGGRRWRLLATRSSYLVDIMAMNRACAAADIVVSDRRLPRGCRPRWLKADRPFLARTGGVAIDLTNGQVRTVAETVGRHPWRWTN